MAKPFTVIAGTPVRTSAVFAPLRVPAGPADPGTITLKVKRGATTAIDLSGSVVHDGAGVYHADLVTDSTHEGVWTVQWAGAGTGPNVVGADVFVVTAPAL